MVLMRRSLVLLALPVAFAAAQTAPEKPSMVLPPVETEVVYVDVFVADKDGKPITGLGPGDFEIFEDGARMDVVNFSAAEVPAEPAAPGAPVVVTPAPAPATPLPAERRVSLAIYVDNFNLHPVNRKRVFEQLQRYLVNLPPGHRATVVSHDQGFRVRLPFTERLDQVRETLRAMEKDPGRGTQADTERRILVRRIEMADTGLPGEADALVEQVRNYAERQAVDTRQSLFEVRRFVDLLGGLPGRKVMLYVADGLTGQPGRAMWQALSNKFGGSGREFASGVFGASQDTDTTAAFRAVIDQANANRVTLHAIDAGSAQAEFSVSAEEAGSGAFGNQRIWDDNAAAQQKLDRASSLSHIAEATGGVKFQANSKLAGNLKEMSADLVASYALAYVPNHSGDGKVHKIDVKVARKDVKIRHREGYRSKTDDERVADLAFSALVTETANPLDVVLEAGKPKPGEKGEFELPILVKLPVAKLRLQQQGEFDVGRLVFYFVVQDTKGGMSAVQRREVPLRFPAGKITADSKQVAAIPIPLRMKPGEYVIAVAVVDELGARRAACSLKVTL